MAKAIKVRWSQVRELFIDTNGKTYTTLEALDLNPKIFKVQWKLLESDAVPVEPKKNACRKCKTPTVNYFYCKVCQIQAETGLDRNEYLAQPKEKRPPRTAEKKKADREKFFLGTYLTQKYTGSKAEDERYVEPKPRLSKKTA